MTEDQIFVYGTLKRGEVAHHLLSGARFLGEATTAPEFELLDCGWYPGLVEGGATAVKGEVYLIQDCDWSQLDEFEEAPEVYQRHQRLIAGFGSTWIYLMRPERARKFPRLNQSSWTGRS